MRRALSTLVVIVVAIFGTAGAFVVESSAGTRSGAVFGPGVATVDVDIEHSRFSTERIKVRPGTLVRFVVRNDDPILHELVVGDASVHERHARGSEASHPPVPGEVSVDPGETGLTIFTFDEPGTFEFACHLPGHRAYGMRGVVDVVPASK